MPPKTSSEKNQKKPLLKNKKEALQKEVLSGAQAQAKDIPKSLERKEASSEIFTNFKEKTTALGHDIEKKHKKGFLKWAVGGALGILGIAAGKDVLDKKSAEKLSNTTADILSDDKKLKKVNDSVVEIKKQQEHVKEIENTLGIKMPSGNWKEKKETYRQADYKIKDLLKDTWENAAYSDEEKTQRRSWIGRIFTFIPAMFIAYPMFNKIKKLEANGTLAKFDALEKSAENVKEKAGKAAKTAKSASDGVKKTTEQMRTNLATKKLKRKAAQNFVREYKSTISEATNNMQYKKITPQEYAKSLEKASTGLFENVKKHGVKKEFVELIKRKQVPGIALKAKAAAKLARIPVGSIGLANAINISILDAIREGKFSTFGKSLFSKQTLLESFVPGVGIYNSVKRARHGSDPIWLKTMDVGLNTAGDLLMAAGIVGGAFTGGAAAAGAYAAKGSMLAVARSWMTKQSLKYAAKSAFKGTKNAAKLSLMTSPVTIMVASVSKHFDQKKIEKSFTDNLLSDEQKRSLDIGKDLQTSA